MINSIIILGTGDGDALNCLREEKVAHVFSEWQLNAHQHLRDNDELIGVRTGHWLSGLSCGFSKSNFGDEALLYTYRARPHFFVDISDRTSDDNAVTAA